MDSRASLTPTDVLLDRLHLIPNELVDRDQWVIWRQEGCGKKATKRPYQSRTPTFHAETDNPLTWSTFANAVATFVDWLHREDRFDGIGYVFVEDDPFTGVDFDDSLNGDIILPGVRNAIRRLGGYAEVSPSMTGVKLWTRTPVTIPAGHTGFIRKGLFGCSKVEVYMCRRYFTVTGWRLDP